MDPDAVFSLLDKLDLSYEVHNHPAVYTVDQAKQHRQEMTHATHAKNLFLKDNKRKQYYLLTAEADEQFRLKHIRKLIGAKKLSFASEEQLQDKLGLEAGAVSPFGLINDTNSEVIFVVSSKIWQAQTLAFHPNVNTQTVVLSGSDFQTVLATLGYQPLQITI